MPTAIAHDGTAITFETAGSGPTVLLAVDPRPVEGPRAEELRRWGTDPALGRALMEGLADAYRVVAFGYEAHVLDHPKPDTLTPEAIVRDVLAVADAAGAERFAYYGYSWLAVVGLQVAVRSERLWGLALGGYPPLDGPYEEMLVLTEAAHRLALDAPAEPAAAPEPGDWSSATMTMSPSQTGQFVTLYRALQGFDDRAAQEHLRCPRLCLVGARDAIDYPEPWGGVHLDIGGRVAARRAELAELGWDVTVLDDLDHLGAMQPAAVLPVLRPWLDAAARAAAPVS